MLFTPRRELGKTGFVATRLGIGDLADRNVPLEVCVDTIRRALDAGLNVIDTAPNYEDGYSEEIVGQAVQGYRDRIFVIDKIDHHDKPIAPQIDGSLARLQLAGVDAFVFHNLASFEVFQKLCSPGDGFDQLAEAVRRGKCRFRGISSHNPEVLLMAMRSGVCDLVMFPVGPFVDLRYVTEVLPLSKQLGIASICFKTFGAGKLVGDTSGYNQPLKMRPRGKMSSGGNDEMDDHLPRITVSECINYTLTLDPDVALLGLSFPNEQDAAFEATKAFRHLTEVEMDQIRKKAIAARQNKGPCWWNPDPEM